MKKTLLTRVVKKLNLQNYMFPNGLERILQIGDYKLSINELDSGGTAYMSQASHREISNRLYELINKEFQPKVILDIGANYGFTSIVAHSKIKHAKVIAVEPSKSLIPYITRNFELNAIKDVEVINAICGELENEAYSFSLNPNTSQDNRVVGENKQWKKQTVPVVNIDSLLKGYDATDSAFIKIDTQGYEEKVFKGGENFLSRNNNWIIKTEFAPYWLKSQGSDPADLLTYLTKRYEVVESAESISFFHNSIDDLFTSPIEEKYVKEFTSYIENLHKDKSGWIDLLVRPKKK